MLRRIGTVAALMMMAVMLLGGTASAQPDQTPATTDTVVPGNACNTPANDNTQGFSDPPGVGRTGVEGGGTPPYCPPEDDPDDGSDDPDGGGEDPGDGGGVT